MKWPDHLNFNICLMSHYKTLHLSDSETMFLLLIYNVSKDFFTNPEKIREIMQLTKDELDTLTTTLLDKKILKIKKNRSNTIFLSLEFLFYKLLDCLKIQNLEEKNLDISEKIFRLYNVNLDEATRLFIVSVIQDGNKPKIVLKIVEKLILANKEINIKNLKKILSDSISTNVNKDNSPEVEITLTDYDWLK